MKSNKQLTFGLLSTIDQPLLPNYINSIHEKGLKNIIVLIDSKFISDKDRKIWEERTGIKFPILNGINFKIFDFAKLRIPFFFIKIITTQIV